MNSFRDTLTRFREAMDGEAMRSPVPDMATLLQRERYTNTRRLRWSAALGAALALGGMLVYRDSVYRDRADRKQARADAALLERIDEDLAQPVPRAMVPLMGLGTATKE